MYIPIMKNRQEELRVIMSMSEFFSDSMIPLIEIIEDEYKTTYEIDEITGSPKLEMKAGNKKKTKVRIPPKKEDAITLRGIEQRLRGKKAFIDFFRFQVDEYDNKRNFKKMVLSLELSRDFLKYRNKILEVNNFSNFIPVISIKSGFEISKHDLLVLIEDLRKSNDPIAIRITDNYLDDYSLFLEDHLSSEDYIMLDIRSQNVISKFIELEDFRDLETKAKKILLNSPRLRSDKNGSFESLSFTNKIDNSVARVYKDYELDGFGDFGGLKDDLPLEGMTNGKGVALALFYVEDVNSFYSISSQNSDLGLKGYKYVSQEVLKQLNILDPDNDCKAIEKVKNMKVKFGNWATWNNITLTRSIHQYFKHQVNN